MAINLTEFDYIREVVKSKSAIILDDGKEYLVELRLGILASNEGFASLNNLIAHLYQTSDATLMKKVVDAMTINETFFFRDLKPFDFLHKHILPALAQSRAETKELNIWSAACSTGQEPYSIAMILHKHFPELARDWQSRIFASDLSHTCLDYARKGHYNQFEVNRGLPVTYLVRYFNQQESRWHLVPEIKNAVRFSEFNLLDNWSKLPKMDVIFLNNVLIYFNLETKKQIFEKIRKQLNPDGYLFLGSSETTFKIAPYFERINSAENVNCYQLAQS